ncbi:MAG TPA: radical SAM protein [Firmicutes bacterium]|nr:radical SAM protein [Bacillota bacterium]
MTREEEFASLYRNGTVYRPLQEEHSILVEVGLGCGWHKCAFCDFTRDPFCWIPLEEVHHSVQTLARLQVPGNRVFLLGQNAMMRPARELLQIFAWIHHYMPQVQEIAMYARADDVLRKTPEELRALRDMGLCDLHIGVESGSDTVLLLANKGETVYDMLTAFQKLDAARIGYFVTSILGLGGKHLWKAHAIETARLYNRIHPKNIWVLALKLFPGTQLHRQASQGLFEPLTPFEMLLEERLLVRELQVENCFYMDTTAMNKYTLAAHLSEGKQGLLNSIQHLLEEEEINQIFGPEEEVLS